MKKFNALFISVIIAIVCAVSLAACSNGNGTTDKQPEGGGETTVAVTSVTLNKNEITLEVGGSETLKATVAPDNATNKTVTWESNKTEIATVVNGKVTAVADGTAVITAKAGGKSDTCTVTVNKKTETKPENPDNPPTGEPDKPTQYTVTFQPNGGTFSNGENTYSVKVNEGEKVNPVTVTREKNYEFLGWFSDEDHTVLWNFNSNTVSKTTTLYAGWKYVNPYQPIIDALQENLETATTSGSNHSPLYINPKVILVYIDRNVLTCKAKTDGGLKDVKLLIKADEHSLIADNLDIEYYIPAITDNTKFATLNTVYDGAYNSDSSTEEQQIVQNTVNKLLNDDYNLIWGAISVTATSGDSFEQRNVGNRLGYYSAFDVDALIEKDGEIFDFSTTVTVIRGEKKLYDTPFEYFLNSEYDSNFSNWSSNYQTYSAYETNYSHTQHGESGSEFDGQPFKLLNLGEVAASSYAEWKKEQEANKNLT